MKPRPSPSNRGHSPDPAILLLLRGALRCGRTDAVAAVKKVNATLYSVGIGGVAGMSFRGRDVLRQLATQTGGKAFFPSRDSEIPIVQDTVGRRRFQCLIRDPPAGGSAHGCEFDAETQAIVDAGATWAALVFGRRF